MITSDAKRTHDIKLGIVTAKATLNKKLLHQQIGLNLRKKLMKCYIWSLRLYGADNLTLRKKDQKYLDSLEMWCCRRMEIIWVNRVKNDEVRVLHTVKNKRNIYIQ
jgi:hypothetical protein